MQTLHCSNCSATSNSSSILNDYNHKTMQTLRCNNCSVSAPALASESSSIIIYDNTKDINQQNNNYLIVGLCLGLLGIIYVMALMIYIRSQLNKQRYSDRMCDSSISNQSQTDPLNRMENGNSGVSCDSSCGTISPNSVTSCSLSAQSETNETDGTRTECESRKSKANVCSYENTKSILFDKTQKIVPQERLSKRCLYINPEFFEPELLKLPPPPAIEFLHRIRELISNARGRIRNFRYKPTLLVIPEDDYFYHDLNKDSENKCLTMMCPPTPPRRIKRAATPFDSHKQLTNLTNITPTLTTSEVREKFDNNNKLFGSCQEKNVKNCIEEVNEELSSFDNNTNSETNAKNTHNIDINKCKLYVKNDSKDKLSEKQPIFSSQPQHKISRKELVMKLNDMKCETINNSELFNRYNQNNCLKIINEANHSVAINNSISPNNFINVLDEDTPLDSLKLLSAKVAKKLSETNVPELNYNCLPHNEYNKLQHLMIDFRNSFGKLTTRNNCDVSSPMKSCDNWTLQSVRHRKLKMNAKEAESSCTTSDNQTSGEECSLEKTKCNHILYLNSSEKNDLKSSSRKLCDCNQQNCLETNRCDNYLDSKYAYNIDTNDSIDTNGELNSFPSTNGYECDIGTTDTDSTDEMSTTSSVKANQFNSFESVSISSDITEDSLNIETQTDVTQPNSNERNKSDKTATVNDNGCPLDVNYTEEDDNGIDACLMELANAQIDCDTQTKYYLNSDSSTNGMSTVYQFKCCNWKHNCAHSHSRHLNEYLSDESVSSSASKNRMSYRGTEDITCFNSHEYRRFGDNDAKLAHNSSINRKKLCSCRMIGYATHQCNTLVKDNRNISDDLCSKSSKPKNKSSKTVITNNHSSYLSNKFSKFLTKTAKNGPKIPTNSKSSYESHASRERKQMNHKINSYIDQIIPNVNAHRTEAKCEHSLLRKQLPKKKLTNGTCKKYIQQRQQINDHNSQRIVNGSPIVRRHQTKHAENCSADDHKNKHLLPVSDKNDSPNGTVIDGNDGSKHHFVTRIPV